MSESIHLYVVVGEKYGSYLLFLHDYYYILEYFKPKSNSIPLSASPTITDEALLSGMNVPTPSDIGSTAHLLTGEPSSRHSKQLSYSAISSVSLYGTPTPSSTRQTTLVPS
jgi:hypothetical protein